MAKGTEALTLELKNASSLKEFTKNNLNEFIDPENNEDARKMIMSIMKDHHITQASISLDIGLPPSTLSEALSGTKKATRETWLKICCYLALEKNAMNLEEINNFLKKNTFKELYPKNPIDAILIFAITNHWSIDETDMELINECDWTIRAENSADSL